MHALFEECCRALSEGQGQAELLARYPDQAAVLQPMLEAVASLRHGGAVAAPRPTTTAALARARFVEAARAAQPRQPVAVTNPLLGLWERLQKWAAEASRGLSTSLQPLPRGLLAVFVSVILFGMVSSGVVAVSATALPGDPLYPVKIAAQDAQVLLTYNSAARAALAESLAEKRRDETWEILRQRRTVTSMSITGQLQVLDENEWQISGLRVQIDQATKVSGVPEIGARVKGSVRAPGDGTLVATSLTIEPARTGLINVPVTATAVPTETATPTPTRTRTATPRRPTATRMLVAPGGLRRPTATPTRRPTATATRDPDASGDSDQACRFCPPDRRGALDHRRSDRAYQCCHAIRWQPAPE